MAERKCQGVTVAADAVCRCAFTVALFTTKTISRGQWRSPALAAGRYTRCGTRGESSIADDGACLLPALVTSRTAMSA